MRYYKFKISFISDFLLIYLNGLFLLLLSILLVDLFKNYLSCFIILVVFWSLKIFTNTTTKKGSLVYYINFLFPTLIIDEAKSKVYFLNNYNVIFLVIIIGFITTLYYVKKDYK